MSMGYQDSNISIQGFDQIAIKEGNRNNFVMQIPLKLSPDKFKQCWASMNEEQQSEGARYQYNNGEDWTDTVLDTMYSALKAGLDHQRDNAEANFHSGLKLQLQNGYDLEPLGILVTPPGETHAWAYFDFKPKV